MAQSKSLCVNVYISVCIYSCICAYMSYVKVGNGEMRDYSSIWVNKYITNDLNGAKSVDVKCLCT